MMISSVEMTSMRAIHHHHKRRWYLLLVGWIPLPCRLSRRMASRLRPFATWYMKEGVMTWHHMNDVSARFAEEPYFLQWRQTCHLSAVQKKVASYLQLYCSSCGRLGAFRSIGWRCQQHQSNVWVRCVCRLNGGGKYWGETPVRWSIPQIGTTAKAWCNESVRSCLSNDALSSEVSI